MTSLRVQLFTLGFMAATATALRDPSVFWQPDRFRLGRALDGAAVNLTFGAMPHACLGRQLAIAQLEEMFAELLKRHGLARAPGRRGRLDHALEQQTVAGAQAEIQSRACA